MNVTTKRKEIVIYKDVKIYVADDGTEFTNKANCNKYERKLNSNIYTQEDLINMIVSDLNDKYSKEQVEEIVNTMENNIIQCLTDVKDKKTVTVRPFTGLTLASKVDDERIFHSNLDGKDYHKPKELKVFAKFTLNFKKKMADKFSK